MEARAPATRFMWWQPLASGKDLDVWALDEIYVGPGKAEEPPSLTEAFDASLPFDDDYFVGYLGATREAHCGYNNSAVFASSSEASNGDQILSTVPMRLPSGSIVQFEINFGCLSVQGDFSVAVQYSDNDGATWSDVLPAQCNPLTSNECKTWVGLQGSRLRARNFQKGWHRITLHLPGTGNHRRIRLTAIAQVSTPRSWALANLYIGSGCGGGCGGHGSCRQDQCMCDAGYMLHNGSCTPSTPLPHDFKERFEQGLRLGNWLMTYTPAGSVRTSPCGPAASGDGFFFNMDGMRALETRDLNLTRTAYLQFSIRMGASASTCRSPSQTSEGVVVAYTTDGSITFTLLGTISYFSYRDSGTVVCVQQTSHAAETLHNSVASSWPSCSQKPPPYPFPFVFRSVSDLTRGSQNNRNTCAVLADKLQRRGGRRLEP